MLPAHILSGTRKPVKTVLSGPRKHSERFGCNSHIGQLNATTSALSLPFAYSIHMLMMLLVFFFFFFFCMCVCACVFMRAICCALCVYYFFLYFLPVLPVSLYHQAKKRRCKKFGFIFSFFKKNKKLNKTDMPRPIFTSSCLVIKGEVRRLHTVVPLLCPWFWQEAPLTAEKARPYLFPKQLNAL